MISVLLGYADITAITSVQGDMRDVLAMKHCSIARYSVHNLNRDVHISGQCRCLEERQCYGQNFGDVAHTGTGLEISIRHTWTLLGQRIW